MISDSRGRGSRARPGRPGDGSESSRNRRSSTYGRCGAPRPGRRHSWARRVFTSADRASSRPGAAAEPTSSASWMSWPTPTRWPAPLKLVVKIRAAEPARHMLTSEAGAAPPYSPSCALGVARTHTPNRRGRPAQSRRRLHRDDPERTPARQLAGTVCRLIACQCVRRDW